MEEMTYKQAKRAIELYEEACDSGLEWDTACYEACYADQLEPEEVESPHDREWNRVDMEDYNEIHYGKD